MLGCVLRAYCDKGIRLLFIVFVHVWKGHNIEELQFQLILKRKIEEL